MTDPSPLPSEVGNARRLEALHDYAILDTAPEKGFDDIVELARLTCAVPVSLVSLVGGRPTVVQGPLGLRPL